MLLGSWNAELDIGLLIMFGDYDYYDSRNYKHVISADRSEVSEVSETWSSALTLNESAALGSGR